MKDSSKSGRLDNLVPLKKGLFGEQTAGWTPGRPAMQGLGCLLLADQMIPVAPGVSLAADIYLPKVPGRYPAVVLFAAYTKELHTAGVPAGTNEVGSPPVYKTWASSTCTNSAVTSSSRRPPRPSIASG